jgi:NitT/TauT family transport system ATP-binding protein
MSAVPGSSKLEVRNLAKVFETRHEKMTALDGATLRVEDNEFVSLVGTSGCGKSTLLSIVAGLQQATSGEVLVSGHPVVGPGRDRGVVPQSDTLFPWLNARQNVEFALRGEKMSKAQRRATAIEQLRLVGLEDFVEASPKQLSGGMRQRVAIARALSYKPEILLMDEPFGALDALTRQVMQELLTLVWERHRLTVLFVTHDVQEAVYISDRVLVMTNRPGRIKKDVKVDLPRPRRHEMFSSPEFRALHAEVFESIREESLQVEKVADVLE